MDFRNLHMVEVPSNEEGWDSAAMLGLHVSSISLTDFRNYEKFSLNDIGPLTVLMGPNAVGKTSVIEAIQMMTDMKSFRTSRFPQMIRWGCDSALVSATFAGDGRDLGLTLNLSEGKRSYKLNGKQKRVQDLKGLLPSVCFSPDDLDLVKGPNANRRAALDDIGSRLSKNFYAVKNDYAKLIKQKNRALKEGASDLYLDSIDEILARVGTQLMSHRMVVIEKMRPAFNRLYADISAGHERVEIAYIPSWETRDADDAISSGEQISAYALQDSSFDRDWAHNRFFEGFSSSREQERIKGKAMIGPHGDKVLFLLNGRNALHYSSQGQQRSIVLAFKLAEASIVQEVLHRRPILLLDDVLSELDEMRRAYFLRFISDDIQTFITSTNAECFDSELMLRADVITLMEEGVMR